MELPLMNPQLLHWLLVAVLLVLPVVVVAALNWSFRKRGGIGKGWGGTLFLSLCWITALFLVFDKVRH